MRNPERTAARRREENEDIVRPDSIVICSGKYGSCEQYTRWLMERLGSDALPYSKQTLGYTSLYRNIIWIGPVRDSAILNLSILWQNYHNFGLDGKKIIVCGVGLGDPDNEDYCTRIARRSGVDFDYCTLHILPGRIDRSRLKRLDRPMFDKFLIDAKRQYGEEIAALINERAASDYNGINAQALDSVIAEILATRH